MFLETTTMEDAVVEWLGSFGVDTDILKDLAVLLVAYVLALPIAWDRERNERSAGLRTFPLVALAACGFIQATETVTRENAEATARIVEGLINGVGFIGGGAILVGKASIRGTATAASLWATGAIGTAVGLGAYETAIVLSIVTFATLRVMTSFKVEGNESSAVLTVSDESTEKNRR
jgi:putative Mg2+ transporter-C (MgtC) family protein